MNIGKLPTFQLADHANSSAVTQAESRKRPGEIVTNPFDV
jgi:hypothetical protein